MGDARKSFSEEFKARVALEALKGLKSILEISNQYEVHPTQVNQWKKRLRDDLPLVFDRKKNGSGDGRHSVDELCKRIQELEHTRSWLKKKVLSLCLDVRKKMVRTDDPDLSVRKQCELLGVNRSSLYYKHADENEYNRRLMELISDKFAQCPWMGVESMVMFLREERQMVCGPKRVRRLMRKMGLKVQCRKFK